MKNIIDFINEALEVENTYLTQSEIKSEKDFRDVAKAKFEEVFGDELDEKEMNDTIDGILKDNAELVENGDWGALIGILNKSFAK